MTINKQIKSISKRIQISVSWAIWHIKFALSKKTKKTCPLCQKQFKVVATDNYLHCGQCKTELDEIAALSTW